MNTSSEYLANGQHMLGNAIPIVASNSTIEIPQEVDARMPLPMQSGYGVNMSMQNAYGSNITNWTQGDHITEMISGTTCTSSCSMAKLCETGAGTRRRRATAKPYNTPPGW